MNKHELLNLDLDLYYEKLSNGLEVLIVPRDNVNNIYVTFSAKYGSNEIEFIPINENNMIKVPAGIAHFLEHKLFEQPDNIDPFSFFSERGADANANTSQTKTTYLFSGPSFFEENLNFLLDYVQSPYFTDKNVKKEKGIIEQEIKMYLDDPGTQMYEILYNNIFINHPAKDSIIGTIKSIKSITKEDLYKCYNTFYHPSNMFVVIVGNVDPEQAINVIKENQNEKEFPNQHNITLKEYSEPDEVAKEEESANMNVSIPKCVVGFKLKLKEPIYQNMLYFSIIFDSKFGATSTLVEELLKEEIINTELLVDYDSTMDHMLLTIEGETKKTKELINKIKNEIKNIKITEEEFERKKKTLISTLIYVSDDIFSLNKSIMNDMIKYGKVRTNRYEQIKNLNYDDFINLIKKTNFNNMSSFTVNPKKNKNVK